MDSSGRKRAPRSTDSSMAQMPAGDAGAVAVPHRQEALAGGTTRCVGGEPARCVGGEPVSCDGGERDGGRLSRRCCRRKEASCVRRVAAQREAAVDRKGSQQEAAAGLRASGRASQAGCAWGFLFYGLDMVGWVVGHQRLGCTRLGMPCHQSKPTSPK